MRLRFVAATAVMLAALPAAATDTSGTKGKPGGSSPGPGVAASASSQDLSDLGSAKPTTMANLSQGSDFGLLNSLAGKNGGKWWTVELTAEMHRLFIQNDLDSQAPGYAPDKLYFYYQLQAKVDLTKYDRIYVRAGMYERFLADQLETGIRAADLRFGYVRTVLLPWQMVLQATAYLTAPTSFDSYLASSITTPAVGLTLARTFYGLTVDFEALGHYYIDKYSSYSGGTDGAYVGGADNTQADFGVLLDLEYAIPYRFLKGLYIGIDAGTDWDWYYGIYPNNDRLATSNGITPPVAFGTQQPVQQDYSDEIYLRYSTPSYGGVTADIIASFANGDPAMGNPQILHGGVDQFYLYWRQNAEFYCSVLLRY